MQHNKPLYLQVKQDLENSILSGRRKPGQEMPSVRSLAAAYQINPNTVQRAVNLLREENLIHLTHRRFFVTGDLLLVRSRREEKAKLLIAQLYQSLSLLGYRRSEVLDELIKY